ncbi:MAG: MFS transporter [Candidatus Bathyarchaeota archaeon]|nr:MFS transporter [Candidatus Bathyarchaeota archaeon]
MTTAENGSRLRSLVFTSLGHFINDGEGFLVPVVAAALVAERGLTPLEVTIMFLAFYSSSSILSVYVGNFADITGKPGPIIAVGLTLISVGFLGFSLSVLYASGMPFLASVTASAFLAGFGGAFYHPLGASVLRSAFHNKSEGKALGINGAVGSVGRALYPSLLVLIAALVTTFNALAILAVVGLFASSVIWLGLKKVPKPASQTNQAVERKTKFSAAFTRGIVALTAVTFVRSFAVIGVNSWIPTFISIQRGVGITNMLGITLTAMYASAIIGQPLFGALLDRFDKRLILGLSSAGCGLSIIGYLSTSGILEIVLLSLFGFFAFSAFPLVFSLASDYAPEGSSSLANALAWGLGVTGGGAVGPIVTGAIIGNDYAHLGFAFEIMVIVVLISAFMTALMPKSQKSTKVALFG